MLGICLSSNAFSGDGLPYFTVSPEICVRELMDELSAAAQSRCLGINTRTRCNRIGKGEKGAELD